MQSQPPLVFGGYSKGGPVVWYRKLWPFQEAWALNHCLARNVSTQAKIKWTALSGDLPQWLLRPISLIAGAADAGAVTFG